MNDSHGMEDVRRLTLFVTGGTGLVGSHVVESAVSKNHHVKALVRQGSDTRLLERWGVELIRGDLENAEALREGCRGADVVVNAAAKVGDWGPLDEFRRLNVHALKFLLDAAVEEKVKRFVHVSSLGVYEGRDHFGTDETVPPAIHALDGYTRSKIEAEDLVMSYVKEKGLAATVVRPGFIYGERDRTVIPKLLKALRDGKFWYLGSGEQALNCVYVKNLVHAIERAAEVPEAVGEIFNITDGQPVSKKRFVTKVAELAGITPPRRKLPRRLAYLAAVLLESRAKRLGLTDPPLINKARYKFLGLHLDFSIAKAQRILGYRPPYDFDLAMTATMNDLAPKPAPENGAQSQTQVTANPAVPAATAP